jgi:hypothetical protein
MIRWNTYVYLSLTFNLYYLFTREFRELGSRCHMANWALKHAGGLGIPSDNLLLNMPEWTRERNGCSRATTASHITRDANPKTKSILQTYLSRL